LPIQLRTVKNDQVWLNTFDQRTLFAVSMHKPNAEVRFASTTLQQPIIYEIPVMH